MKKLYNVYVIKEMVNVQRAIIELSSYSYASFVLSNLPRAYITR